MSHKQFQAIFSILLLVSLFLGLSSPVSAGIAPQTGTPPAQPVSPLPVVSLPVKHDLSQPLSEMKLSVAPTVVDRLQIPHFTLPKSLNASRVPSVDTAVQNAPVTSKMPALLANFNGIANTYGIAPPDTQGDFGFDAATGKKYYMQWVNLGIQVWDVTNPAAPVSVFGPSNGNTIWAGFGGRCQTDNSGDPIVLFDEQAGRWMISQFAVSAAPYYNCMAVSQTADPTGAWYRYAFNYGAKMNDYPKFGVWPDGYYMSVNQFTGTSWAGAGVAVYERDQMLIGGAARQVIVDLYSVNAGFGGMLPSDAEGTPPAAGTPAYFAEVDDSTYGLGAVDQMRIWQFNTNWATNTYSFGLAGLPNQVLPVTNYTPLCGATRLCVPQSGTTQKIDAIGDRLMYRLAYRKLDDGSEHMVVNHTVDVGSTRAGVRWYELVKSGANWAITQQGTYAGDTADSIHRWMGSISMDRMGNIALGYSMSSATTFPSLGLVGRLTADPVNTLPQGELIAFAGPAAQTGVDRWGDYSSMSIDPTDGCTFWYTNEYSTGGWNWATRIVAFKFPSCTPIPLGQITGTVKDTSNNPLAGAQVSAGFYGTTTAADGSYTINLPEETYSVTASKFGYISETQTGVVVTASTPAVANFVLDSAMIRNVHGVVSDATVGGHSWPLYARITIAGYPGGDIYTNPVTGAYSVNLPEASTVTFTVTAIAPGYTTQSVNVTVPAADLVQNFGLLTNPITCSAPGYTLVGGMLEKFDSVTAPALPANWTFTRTAGASTTTAWKTNTGTRHPSGGGAVSAPNVAYFNSWSESTGNAARLHYQVPFNFTTITPRQVTFQMYHDTGYTTLNETLQVVVSTNGGTSWTQVGTPISRYSATVGWLLHTVDLSAYAAETSVLVGFNAVSAYGNDMHIDDVTIGATPTCTALSGGLLLGNVYDQNTTTALNGAAVTIPGASTLTTAATPDPAIADGFYYGFAPASAALAVSATKYAYGVDSHTLAIANNTVTQQDFDLHAGLLTKSPPSFDVTLVAGTTGNRTLTLNNTGSLALDYAIREVNTPVSGPIAPIFDPNGRHLGPKNLDLPNLNGIAYYLTPKRSAYQPLPIAAAGTIIGTYPSGLLGSWGVGVDQVTNTVWVGNISALSGDNYDYEYTLAGAATGRKMPFASWMGTFAADMTYDPVNGTLWQINVGGDNCVYEMNPISLLPTGGKICPAFATSQRGLAYDPVTDTFFSGSWNDSMIVRFERDGTILQQVNVALPIAGLAYNASTGHLFVTNTGTSVAFDFSVLDVNAGYTNIGNFNTTGLSGGEAGLDIDCDGHLWAANQTTKNILEIDSGETGVCNYQDIPWLSETPASGTILSGASPLDVTLTFDATTLLPGNYEAQLRLAHNTPYAIGNVPVALHVTAAAGTGTVEGVVTGLAVCDAAGAVLESATVEVRDNANALVTTLTTDAAGHYIWTGPITGNNYSLTVIKTGYINGSATVTLVDSTTVTQNFSVRLNQPCISAAPSPMLKSVIQGNTATKNLVLTNTGAAATTYSLSDFIRTLSHATELVLDGGFEAGVGSGNWVEYSANYGTPLCSVATCGAASAGPRTGTYWAWFGGSATGDTGYVSQSVTIDAGAANLSFWAEQSACGTGGASNYLRVMVDTTEVWRTDALDPACGTVGYRNINVDLSAYADGAAHTLKFDSVTVGSGSFLVDDISLAWTGGDALWLTEVPATGSLPADTGSATIALGFDAIGQSIGDHLATIRITDGSGRVVDVPVTMKVFDPTAITLNRVEARSQSALPVLPLALAGVLLLGAVVVLKKRK